MFLLGLALGGGYLAWAIWSPAYPPRHEHMRAMDTLRDQDPFPHGACWCGGALDARGICPDRCARDSWDRR